MTYFWSDESDDDDEDDDEQELQAELERIREERAVAQAKKVQEEQEANERLHKESSMKGNPLMNNSDESAMVSDMMDQSLLFLPVHYFAVQEKMERWCCVSKPDKRWAWTQETIH